MNWPLVPLKDVGVWYGGGTPSKSNQSFWSDGTVPWLSPKDMGTDTLAGTSDKITESAVAGSAVKRVPAGSVAMVMRSGILEHSFPVAVVPFETTLNQDMKAIVPHHGIEAKWIALGLRAYEQEILRTTRKAGTTVASIETPRLRDFPLPVPPLEEQRRIVTILDDHLSRLDAASEYLRSTQRRLVTWERATLDALFGGNPTIPLSDLIVDIEAGRSFGAGNAPATEDEWGIVKVSAMTWGVFRPEENKAVSAGMVDPRFEIREGDLLVSRANTAEYVGASVLVGPVRPRLLLSDKSMRIRPRAGVESAWLWRALQAPSARRQISALATGTKDSMRNISQAALRGVLLPAANELQRSQALTEYDLVGEQIARLRADVATAVVRHNLLRRSLLAAAFSGQLTSGRELKEEVA